MKLRNLAVGLALLTTGTIVGVTTQQLASADVSSGDRPVLVPIESCRLIDTRPAFQVGPRPVPLGAGETLTLDTQQAGTECTGDIPTDATAIAANVTAPDSSGESFITLWDSGPRPNGSTLNPQPGQLVFNAATIDLDGTNFNIYNNANNVHVIIDVTGYYEHHDHDDRYDTKEQVDAKVESAADGRLPADSTMVPIARFTIEPGGAVTTVETRPPLTGPPTATWNVNRWLVSLPGERFLVFDQQAFCIPVGAAARLVSVTSSEPNLVVYTRDLDGDPIQTSVYCTVYADAPTP